MKLQKTFVRKIYPWIFLPDFILRIFFLLKILIPSRSKLSYKKRKMRKNWQLKELVEPNLTNLVNLYEILDIIIIDPSSETKVPDQTPFYNLDLIIIQNPWFYDRTNRSIDTIRDSWHFLDSNSMCVDRSMNIHQPWDWCNEDTLDKGVHVHEGRYYRACVTGSGDRSGEEGESRAPR